jgi:hypothetical protein
LGAVARIGDMGRIGLWRLLGLAALIGGLGAASPSAPSAAAKGLETLGAKGVGLPGSPYRYETLAPHAPKAGNRWTVVVRTDRRGGAVSRWWHLRGSWLIPAAAYDRSPTGLSADGKRLVLSSFRYADPAAGLPASRSSTPARIRASAPGRDRCR